MRRAVRDGAGERAFLAEKGFAPPTRCKACRDARKAARAKRTPPAAGAGDAAEAAARTRVPKARVPKTSSRKRPRRPACRLGHGSASARRGRSKRRSNAKSRADAAAETAERLAALAVSRGEADE